MTARQEREAYLQEQHEDALDKAARECGYESVYDQARSEYANQYPGIQSSRTPEEVRRFLDEKARKIVAAAVEERDSITRAIAMNNF